ncbi:MAG: methyltransferase domain-containing protein [Gammaproteobacteria bacterium]|nr:methyltransferase domain-containing protein [Gammaproteobacteria bacterium]
MKFDMGPGEVSAFEAKSMAQWIVFSPFIFQATVVMRDRGLLAGIDAAGETGIDAPRLADQCGLSLYGTRVLLDFAVDIGLVQEAGGTYTLAKTGYFILNDDMTRVNMNFTRDVCYQALGALDESIRDGKPCGLAALGDWENLYDGLTCLPGSASESWFRFDHFYSDRVFDEFLPVVFSRPVKEILDIGGNTGRWAQRCLDHNQHVRVTIMDLPQQLAIARENIAAAGYSDRFNEYPLDVLREDRPYYKGADVIWMSQFLDCFSEQEILKILGNAVAVMDSNTELYIIELFWNRQKYDAARFSLNATSLYFTCIANGKSRMYHSEDIKALVQQTGLVVEQETDDIGEGHTVLRCRLA